VPSQSALAPRPHLPFYKISTLALLLKTPQKNGEYPPRVVRVLTVQLSYGMGAFVCEMIGV